MTLLPADQPGSELSQWTDPLVGDVISAGYTRLIQDHAAMASLVRCHILLWRCLLAGREDWQTYYRELSRLAARARIQDAALDAMNAQVVAELLHTIAARYTRSPRQAGRLSVEVTRAACRLAKIPSRAVA